MLPVAAGIATVVVLPEATAVVTRKSKYAPVLSPEDAGILITLSKVPCIKTTDPDWAIVNASVIAPEASQVVMIGCLAVSVLEVEIAPAAETAKPVVSTPVFAATEIDSKPFIERTGPLKVVLAII